ncbi:hypothetical protein TVAG_327810 [Trichomonas vaginalis G3]|uniref:Uncharacterized protein n=1 Tax=Trichomonas vaginalis (strain ATCC PRA-98 / G3) TaxID=412133 RepID=A2G083_TRIV3|nr:hypothetical protein TVAGG3_0044270 [Trichomonas vaginalis G3]EAX89439.1 hypothetical protein TVAG_327810 [Trichomonas vaginalis G3]KAI5540914.1 hypothetical protein TVAGG3_0044270 [Trichomonas vaginalis G3]|eukprot:XP_001302369.1 hypothetical protein [Trichomonas vaginalis G3]
MHITELPLAVPIFVLPAGVVTESELEVINKLNEKTTTIETKNAHDFNEFCLKRKLKHGDSFEAQFVPFNNLDEFLQYFNIFNLSGRFSFQDCYTVVVLIDFTVNLDVSRVQQNFEQIFQNAKFSKRIVYFLYNCPADELVEIPRFYQLLQSFNLSTSTQTITNFVKPHVIDSIMMTDRFVNYAGKKKFAHAYESDTPNAFRIVSHDPNMVIKSIEQFPKASDGSPEMVAAICELHALVDEKYRGLIKPLSKSMLELSPWSLNESDSQAFCSFSAACGAYLKFNKFTKAVDCALHAMKMEQKVMTDKYILSIIANHISDDMEYRSWCFIKILEATNNFHKAALVSYRVGQAFKKHEPIQGQIKKWIDFMIESIRIFHSRNAMGIELKTLFSGILSEILESGLPISLYQSNKLFIEIFALQGPLLPPNTQRDLNSFLLTASNNDTNYSYKFPFSIIQAEAIPPQASIQLPKTMSSVFIYNAVSKSNQNLVIPVGYPQRIAAKIRNPYKIPIKISYLVSHVDGLQCERHNADFKALCDTDVICNVTPLVEGSFTIDSLMVCMYDIPTMVKLPQPITFKSVANAPTFTVRTDLPNNKTIEAYDGESLTFHVWVLNTSSRTEISQAQLQFRPDVIHTVTCSAHDMFIEPFDERSFTITFVANTGMKNLSFSVVCTTSSNVTSILSIDRPINVVPAITIYSIYPLPLVPEVPLTPQSNIVFLAVELLNSSSEALNVNCSFDRSAGEFPGGFIGSEKLIGAIAGNGNNYVFLLAAARDELMKCIETFNDAQRAAALRSHVETVTNKKLTSNEFKVIRKQAAVGSFFEKHLSVEWNSANGRNGKVDMRLLQPEKSVIDLIEAENVTVSLKVLNSYGHEIQPDKVPVNSDIMIIVTTSKECNSCSIMMFNEPNVVWEDSLTQELNSSEFKFKLYFIEQNTYNFTVRYTVDGRELKSPFTVTAL